MAQIADITVKKADGTTNIIYKALVGSAGDGKPAVWRADSVSTIPLNCPTFTLQSRSNSAGTTRILQFNFRMPIISIVNGQPVVVGHQTGNGTFPILQDQDWSQVQEGIAQQLNLLASAAIKAALVEGYAPRS